MLERAPSVSLLGGNMKKIGLLVLLVATAALGAIGSWIVRRANAVHARLGRFPRRPTFPIQRVQMPTYADVYCAGFINRQTLPDANFVAGGLDTPQTTKFVKDDVVYLQGTGYTCRRGVRDCPRACATSTSMRCIPDSAS